ncbi:MAG: hypothetical protein ABSB15_27620 [Bryobacteraceae bacterium]|jgi:hypothetical protein
MPDELTLGEFSRQILPRLSSNRTFPNWPPDSFALCLSVLKRTGAYVPLLSDWPPHPRRADALNGWISEARHLGEMWRQSWNAGNTFTELSGAWEVLCASLDIPLDEIILQLPICEALIRIVAAADEASEGVGAPLNDDDRLDGDVFLSTAEAHLMAFGTVCNEVDRARLRTLPRMHTPQSGLTERSLSLYLSLIDSCEVAPEWLSSPFIQKESFNMLLVPWPFEVLVKQFRVVTDLAESLLPDEFGFFTYDVESHVDLVDIVKSLYKEAMRKLGRVDGVVFPEAALAIEQFHAIRKELPQDCFLVAGVGRGASGKTRGTNEVRLSFPPLEEVVQRKHHPWKLDESQVIQYGLGGVLSPSFDWWEYADFTDRQLRFIAISADLVLTVLICEDLARPDPVANLVRSVGPNLVIALLMDGPQTKQRWAARYATALADDPGCSVLSLTSKGMAHISRPGTETNKSRVVAIWKDRFGPANEIELPEGCDAVAVSLSIRYEEEFTADGRGDDNNAAYPVLSGVHPIKSKVSTTR